ncbi:PsiF family protein [Methylobacterium marchantiae]|uniref:PsiF family protein n=1 Tax=Methylobacterium marchantiae TaxID=600331 RepID=A0ABW3X102_9HYPH
MTRFLFVLGVVGGLAGVQATAASAALAGKLGSCRTDGVAKGLKGDDLKTFMKTCKVDARKACIDEAKAAKTAKPDMHTYLKTCMRG